MPLELPRADDLRIVRSICHYLRSGTEKSCRVKAVQDWIAKVAAKPGSSWHRSRAYHYTSAAKELGLISKGQKNQFKLTREGRRMIWCHPGAIDPKSPLNAEEKSLFRELLTNYEAVRHYLAFYMPEGNAPDSLAEFVRAGKPIQIERFRPEAYKLKTASARELEIERPEKG